MTPIILATDPDWTQLPLPFPEQDEQPTQQPLPLEFD